MACQLSILSLESQHPIEIRKIVCIFSRKIPLFSRGFIFPLDNLPIIMKVWLKIFYQSLHKSRIPPFTTFNFYKATNMSNYSWATDRETKYSVCTVFQKKRDPQNGCEYKGFASSKDLYRNFGIGLFHLTSAPLPSPMRTHQILQGEGFL